jgi:hypothetical protein
MVFILQFCGIAQLAIVHKVYLAKFGNIQKVPHFGKPYK